MTTTGEVDRFARERQDADRRYNDALTVLDRAIVHVAALPAFDRAEFSKLTNALIVFLQQITLFVESKDREIVANQAARFDGVDRSLELMTELRVQMSVVQRAIQTLTRLQNDDRGPAATVKAGHRDAGPEPSTVIDPGFRYVAFEDAFRGSDAAIAARLRTYVPIFAGADDVIDLGCGRGELLAALRDAGISARGVDVSADKATIARGHGLDAVQGDALSFLSAQPDDALGGIIATQVIEHLEPKYLMRLLEAASHKLRRGAPIVLETINAACWLAFFSSYLRDFTHVRPVHPETLQYLLRANGFERVEIRYSAPVPDHMKMRTCAMPAELSSAADPVAKALGALAHTVNANAVILNNLMFTHMDYAAIGLRA
ncbi:MAG TPA: methyltransferase domain-containing protein [Vicinamibacterales bacterium]